MGTLKHAIGNVLMIALDCDKISHAFARSRVNTSWRFVNVDTLLSTLLYLTDHFSVLFFSLFATFLPFLRLILHSQLTNLAAPIYPDLSFDSPVLLSIFFIIFRVVYAIELLVIDFLIKILCYILLSDGFKTLFKYYLCRHSLFTVQLPIIFSLHLFPQYCSGAINLFLGETATKFSKLE